MTVAQNFYAAAPLHLNGKVESVISHTEHNLGLYVIDQFIVPKNSDTITKTYAGLEGIDAHVVTAALWSETDLVERVGISLVPIPAYASLWSGRLNVSTGHVQEDYLKCDTLVTVVARRNNEFYSFYAKDVDTIQQRHRLRNRLTMSYLKGLGVGYTRKIIYSSTTPSVSSYDRWVNTSTKVVYFSNGASWITSYSHINPLEGVAEGSVFTLTCNPDSSPPTNAAVGDLWFVTDSKVLLEYTAEDGWTDGVTGPFIIRNAKGYSSIDDKYQSLALHEAGFYYEDATSYEDPPWKPGVTGDWATLNPKKLPIDRAYVSMHEIGFINPVPISNPIIMSMYTLQSTAFLGYVRNSTGDIRGAVIYSWEWANVRYLVHSSSATSSVSYLHKEEDVGGLSPSVVYKKVESTPSWPTMLIKDSADKVVFNSSEIGSGVFTQLKRPLISRHPTRGTSGLVRNNTVAREMDAENLANLQQGQLLPSVNGIPWPYIVCGSYFALQVTTQNRSERLSGNIIEGYKYLKGSGAAFMVLCCDTDFNTTTFTFNMKFTFRPYAYLSAKGPEKVGGMVSALVSAVKGDISKAMEKLGNINLATWDLFKPSIETVNNFSSTGNLNAIINHFSPPAAGVTAFSTSSLIKRADDAGVDVISNLTPSSNSSAYNPVQGSIINNFDEDIFMHINDITVNVNATLTTAELAKFYVGRTPQGTRVTFTAADIYAAYAEFCSIGLPSTHTSYGITNKPKLSTSSGVGVWLYDTSGNINTSVDKQLLMLFFCFCDEYLKYDKGLSVVSHYNELYSLTMFSDAGYNNYFYYTDVPNDINDFSQGFTSTRTDRSKFLYYRLDTYGRTESTGQQTHGVWFKYFRVSDSLSSILSNVGYYNKLNNGTYAEVGNKQIEFRENISNATVTIDLPTVDEDNPEDPMNQLTGPRLLTSLQLARMLAGPSKGWVFDSDWSDWGDEGRVLPQGYVIVPIKNTEYEHEAVKTTLSISATSFVITVEGDYNEVTKADAMEVVNSLYYTLLDVYSYDSLKESTVNSSYSIDIQLLEGMKLHSSITNIPEANPLLWEKPKSWYEMYYWKQVVLGSIVHSWVNKNEFLFVLNKNLYRNRISYSGLDFRSKENLLTDGNGNLTVVSEKDAADIKRFTIQSLELAEFGVTSWRKTPGTSSYELIYNHLNAPVFGESINSEGKLVLNISAGGRAPSSLNHSSLYATNEPIAV